MTLTLMDIYNECAGQPWSMYDADAESIDDLESALKISINKAISYLWNFQPWHFRYYDMSFRTRAGQASYATPDGEILKKTINNEVKYCIKYGTKFLSYVDNYEVLDEATGEPDSFYMENDRIYLYPTPDASYKIDIKYLLLPYGLDASDDYVYELKEETDYINIPEKYETLFKNCLISLSMMYAIADESDENYSGYENQYKDALDILIQYCKNTLNDRKIIW